MALAELENVSKSYGKGEAATPAIQNVSLTVEKNEFIAITGVSGVGKTTLARVLGLLEMPDSGSYYFDQTNVIDLKDAERTSMRCERIGWIFPDFGLVPYMSVAANIGMAMVYNDVKNKDRTFQVNRLLKQVGLTDKAKKRVASLPNECKQRAALARALVNKPSLIIADEPTNNLDSRATKKFMKMLSKLPERGYTIVTTTHDPAGAEFATRHIHMRDGIIEPARQSESRQEAGV